jgi:hypothetical protein
LCQRTNAHAEQLILAFLPPKVPYLVIPPLSSIDWDKGQDNQRIKRPNVNTERNCSRIDRCFVMINYRFAARPGIEHPESRIDLCGLRELRG